jgi:hypothetical protein
MQVRTRSRVLDPHLLCRLNDAFVSHLARGQSVVIALAPPVVVLFAVVLGMNPASLAGHVTACCELPANMHPSVAARLPIARLLA